MLPNVRSYVQEKYSQGRNDAFPDMGSLPRMTPLILPHVWLQFVGELLDHPVYENFRLPFQILYFFTVAELREICE